jgi:hypothetical protein
VDRTAGKGKLTLRVWLHNVNGDVRSRVAVHKAVVGEKPGHFNAWHGGKAVN